MNIEYMEIGPTPYDEDCAQVGSYNYRELARKEMNAFINQLNRTFPDANEKGISFKVKWFSHDFGSYGEVCMYWNIDDPIADQYVYAIDSNLPPKWDEEAIKELESAND